MSRPALLDSSYLIDLECETAAGDVGPARRFLPSLRGRRIVVSIVSVEELLEGAVDDAAALSSLLRLRLGENDAWLVATAESIDADIVAADRAAFEKLGPRYLRFR